MRKGTEPGGSQPAPADEQRPMERQHAAIETHQTEIDDRLEVVRGLAAGRYLDSDGPRKAYLDGQRDALDWSARVIKDIPHVNPHPWDPRDITDERLEEWFKVMLSGANNENWGNVRANIDRLDETLEELQDDTDQPEETDGE